MSNRFFLSLTKFFPPTFLSESQIQYVNIDLLHSKYRTTFVATFYFFNLIAFVGNLRIPVRVSSEVETT